MGIAAAKGLGIKLIGVDSNDFINKTPHMILGCIWQAIRMVIAKKITLKDTPEIFRLLEEGEELKDLLKLSSETILIRWINYHLGKAGQPKKVTNLGKDLSDSVALFHVLNRLDASKCPLDGVDDESLEARAEKMISNSLALGVPDVVRPRDITTGNVKVNTLFVSYIFNTKHGLEDLTAEEYEAAAMIDDDIEGSREERAFRLWINSLGIEDVYVNDLCEEVKDGVLLNKVLNKIDESVVEWKKVDPKPKNDFGKNINNNTMIEACKKLKIKLIGVGGVDITKGEKKHVLTVVWQLVKLNYLRLIGNKSEDDLVKWANDTVGGKHPSIQSLKDKQMSDSKFLIHVLSAIEPRAVNWDLVLPGESEEEKQNNAKYAISIARKLGAVIFCVWEDIVNVNPKQMLIFFAAVSEIQQELQAAK
uniref:Calponin-homology (CH) domain-containing protein n=1 Tax=Strombidium rassoulzadegani TaxID=1082188 RepID=A0A7S3FXQ5_9SPIT|mmetsp:Transcript_7936/g.13317  ORF Transcript_7936/g.13317 Transcript_7936/m.13317 type:complete len:420 (+) Transcript_7936:617-1876(+)